ncbi:MAG: hypothetical protein GQ477_02965 [Nanohaloarchaea archaeon]|nr:hypothetical protein [Candidatus Nanohaloarchaea archaeon]
MNKNILSIHILLFIITIIFIYIYIDSYTENIDSESEGEYENNLDSIQSSKEERDQTVFGSGFDMVSCEQVTEKDIYELCTRIMKNNPDEFEIIMMANKFNQHIGPNNIYGAKMALYAKKLLNGTNNEISVLSEAGTKPLISCLNDGIMIAIGATFGRGLIENDPLQSKLAATFFYKNKSVRLEVKSENLEFTQKYIADSLKKHQSMNNDYFKDVRDMGLYVWEHFPQDDLFIITYPENENYCDFNDDSIYVYINRLHNFFHTEPTDEKILAFIEQDECVYNGSIIKDDFTLTILSIWKSNDETILFEHIIGEEIL